MEKKESKDPGAEEKRRQLFFRQKETLDIFLAKGAISQAQYNKSFGDLKQKMGIDPDDGPMQ